MLCPHCLTSYHANESSLDLSGDTDFFWRVSWQKCPACLKFIIALLKYRPNVGKSYDSAARTLGGSDLVYPKAIARKPLPPSLIPKKIAQDYAEACLVLADSAKASAALSRRCLQTILREHAKVNASDLSKEIDAVLASKQLPEYLASDIDAIRNIGNFAAHPIKSTSSGEIVDVEPGEAEWNLDVLEGLLDFYFIGPAEAKKKRDALNKKLTDAGKPPLKTP